MKKKYYCIKTIKMNPSGNVGFYAGKIYEMRKDISGQRDWNCVSEVSKSHILGEAHLRQWFIPADEITDEILDKELFEL
jgi:hypothetical protein